MSDMKWSEGDWALILGASSGFGEAAALELAGLGFEHHWACIWIENPPYPMRNVS